MGEDLSLLQLGSERRASRAGATETDQHRDRDYDSIEELRQIADGRNDILAEAKKSGELDALSKKWLGRPAGDLPS